MLKIGKNCLILLPTGTENFESLPIKKKKKKKSKNPDVVIFAIPLLNWLCNTCIICIIQGGQKYMFQHIAYIF